MLRRSAKSANASAAGRRPARRNWIDPDDAPEITDEMLDRAEIVIGGKVVQRGRPALGDAAKMTVTIRLDPDVVAAYKDGGPGWQTRLNADLRRVKKLGKARAR